MRIESCLLRRVHRLLLPVEVSGPEETWGRRCEYDVDVPVDGKYALQICRVAAESRSLEVLFGDRRVTSCRIGAAFSSASTKQGGDPAFNSSEAKRECVSEIMITTPSTCR